MTTLNFGVIIIIRAMSFTMPKTILSIKGDGKTEKPTPPLFAVLQW